MADSKTVTDGKYIVIGRNAVIEALRASVSIDKVFIAKGETDGTLRHIASAAREAGIPVAEADRRKLDLLCKEAGEEGHIVHQGAAAVIPVADYATIDDILALAKQRNELPLIIICDEISDPYNLGAIIRTCEAAGAHGVIIPKRRNAGLSPTVAKASSGAVFHVKIARVPNITAAMRELKQHGVWIFGAQADARSTLWDTDLTGASAIVIGSEGAGISRLVRENCDFLLSIPMAGKLSSLNASISASILLYEANRQRR